MCACQMILIVNRIIALCQLRFYLNSCLAGKTGLGWSAQLSGMTRGTDSLFVGKTEFGSSAQLSGTKRGTAFRDEIQSP